MQLVTQQVSESCHSLERQNTQLDLESENDGSTQPDDRIGRHVSSPSISRVKPTREMQMSA